MDCISVLIADQHPVVLHGVGSVLGAEPDFTIVARCGDGASCIEAIRLFTPDIAVLDLSMLDLSWRDIISTIKSENIATRFVIFTASVERDDLIALAEAGAYAVVPKDAEIEVLVQSLRQVAAGYRLLPQGAPSAVASREVSTERDLTLLTDRERQIMRLVSEGLSNKEIGRRLNISDGTIKVHLHHIFQKLDISNRTALAAFAISQGDNAEPVRGAPSISVES